MKKANNFVREIEDQLAGREQQLLLLRNTVWTFLNGDHTATDIKAYQKLVREQENELGAIFHWLLDQKDKPEEYKRAANNLCQRCRNLNEYTREISKALADDYADHPDTKAKAVADFLKSASFFFVPSSFLLAAQARGVGGPHVNATEAVTAGFGISSAILFRKKIIGGLKAGGKALCNGADIIINSNLVLYCAREKIRENNKAIARIFNRANALH